MFIYIRSVMRADRLRPGLVLFDTERRGRGTYDRIYEVVGRIPEGRVATYGQIAGLAGLPGGARQVGYALAALDDESEVPWHRVINAQGRVSPRVEPIYAKIQRSLLEAEGIAFDAEDRISLTRFRWCGGEDSG